MGNIRMCRFAVVFLPVVLVLAGLLMYHSSSPITAQSLRTLNKAILFSKSVAASNRALSTSIWSVPLVVFLETGLMFGFFLPGDSLLIALGMYGAVGHVNLSLLVPSSIFAAIAGDQVNYAVGRHLDEALVNRFQIVRRNLLHASEFYSKYGGRVIMLARFLPLVRTFAPAAAGVAKMNYSKFVLFNVIGGTLWVLSMTVTGYFIGVAIPSTANYMHLTIPIAVVATLFLSLLKMTRS